MSRCGGSKPTGEPCERIVPASQDYCYSHDLDRVEERRRNVSRAGKSKPNRDVADTKRRLSELAYDLDALVERGEFVPRSFLAGHSYEESLEHFAQKNAKK